MVGRLAPTPSVVGFGSLFYGDRQSSECSRVRVTEGLGESTAGVSRPTALMSEALTFACLEQAWATPDRHGLPQPRGCRRVHIDALCLHMSAAFSVPALSMRESGSPVDAPRIGKLTARRAIWVRSNGVV